MRAEPFYKLKIIAGLHKDAELFIEPQVRYCIGSSDDCDVILLDSGLGQRHLSFQVSDDGIHLEDTDDTVLVDGCPCAGTPYVISCFQVITLGQAHLAIGPANEAWPSIKPPPLQPTDTAAMIRDLVPVYSDPSLPQAVAIEGFFNRALGALSQMFSRVDKKILITAGTFLLALGAFAFDTWLSCAPMQTVTAGTRDQAAISPTLRKSFLMKMVDTIRNARNDTLVSAGLVEPAVAIQAENAATTSEDPVDHIRHELKRTWGPHLIETRIDDRSIQFKGYDEHDRRQNMVLSLAQNEQGQMNAQALTLTPRKKKAILSRLGDIIRVKVDVTEDMEHVCQRVLEKKGIRRAKAKFNLEDNTFTLKGQSDRNTIAAIGDIIARAFPNTKIDNQIKISGPKTPRLNISGVSTSGAPHVILNDGSKVFGGGRLSNGCTVVGIENDHILMNCRGFRRKHTL